MEQLTTYIINLPRRSERKESVLKEFENQEEFDVHVFEAYEEPRGAWGLWESIVAIVKIAKKEDLDAVLICEDDHAFTFAYDSHLFLQDVHTAADLGCQILLGGIGGFGNAIPVKQRLLWVDWFWCTQFMVVFHEAFDTILNTQFDANKDVADEFLSKILSNKLVLYPFVSLQKDTGHSDVTLSNNRKGTISRHFAMARHKMESYQRVFKKYNIFQAQHSPQPYNYPPCHYLTTSNEPKLHIGCGPFIKEGWLNVDINPHKGAEFLDASADFPFPDESFHFVFSEHLLEHLDYFGGKNLITESYRVLKRGGVLRLAIPNLDFLIQLYLHPEKRISKRYIEWSVMHYSSWLHDDFVKQQIPASVIVNHYMHAWGHKMVYDKELLTSMLKRAGFEKISFCEIGESEYPSLTNLEEHGKMIPAWANKLETMVVEAVKGGPTI